MKNILQPLFDAEIKNVQAVSGGDINEAYKVDCANSPPLFIKVNRSSDALDVFTQECKGLSVLSDTLPGITPQIVNIKSIAQGAALILEYLSPVSWTEQDYYALGQKLAKIHQKTADNFGFEANNYLGHLHQSNHHHSEFLSFFLEERIMPLINKAVAQNVLEKKYLHWDNDSYNILDDIIPKEPPSLIHGDLWSGNIMNTTKGPKIIDPAVAFSHREFDIAMSKLFGGFTATFYQGYNDTFPLQPNWKQRTDLFQLYPILAHLVMFGSGYYASTIRILDKYSK